MVTADKDTAFSIPVSNKEKKAAEHLRKKFELVLKELEEFSKFLLVFFDHVDDLDDQTDLSKLSPLITKYEAKLKKKFNVFIKKLESALEDYNEAFADTELDNMRDLLIENAKVMRKSLLELIKLFKKVEDPEFLRESKTTLGNIQKSIEGLELVIRNELFNHIDFDILGRIRLGVHEAPLVLRGQ